MALSLRLRGLKIAQLGKLKSYCFFAVFREMTGYVQLSKIKGTTMKTAIFAFSVCCAGAILAQDKPQSGGAASQRGDQTNQIVRSYTAGSGKYRINIDSSIA